MASAEKDTVAEGDWRKRESFTSAMVQILVVGLVLAGGVYYWYQRGVQRKEERERVVNAKTFAIRDNPSDLNRALKELEPLIQPGSKAKDALALAADIHTEFWLMHRVPGSEEKARTFLAAAEKANSRSEERYSSRLLALVAEGKSKDALTMAEDLRMKGASSPKIWFALALGQQATGNLALAKQAYSQAAEKGWRSPRLLDAYAEQLLNEGHYGQALDVFQKGISANPDHIRSRLGVAISRLRKRDGTKDSSDIVRDVLSQEAELTPGLRARALAAKAELAIFEDRLDDAVAIAQEGLGQNPDDVYAHLAKARALAKKKDPSALAAFKELVAKQKNLPLAYFDGASLLQEAGDPEGALTLLNQYEDIFKSVLLSSVDGKSTAAIDRDDRYWILRGDVQRAAKHDADAMAAYEKAIAANSLNLARAHYSKGALLLSQKEYDKAIEELALVTPADGTGLIGEAYLAMGETLFAKKDFPTGCQNFAFALSRFKNQQVPRERLNGILEDVTRKLIAGNQKPIAKLWMEEAKPLIQ